MEFFTALFSDNYLCREQSLELPPSNAFGRLLAHKLGDYYHLTHFVDNNVTSVRLHRTPFCRLPEPLSTIHAVNNTTPPPTMPLMKIMRRTGPSVEGSVTGSGIPSKTTSEAGESGNDGEHGGGGSSVDSTPVKDRMILSREEKEVKYQKARERIFRDFPESKLSDNAGVDSSLSRSSEKANRQRTPHDDTFEVRSQYNVYYPGGHHYSSGPVSYGIPANDGPFPTQQPYMLPPSPASMTYIQDTPSNAMYPSPLGMNVPQYPMALSHQMAPSPAWQGGGLSGQQSPFAVYAQPPSMMGQPQKSPVMSYGISSASAYQPMAASWPPPPQPHYKGNFQQPSYRNQPPPPPPPAAAVHCFPPQPMASPYPSSQFQPMKPGMQNYSAGPQQALPGNYNRSLFDPQTRSFVPGSRYPPRSNNNNQAYPYFGSQGQQPQWGIGDSRSYETAIGGNSGGRKDSIAKWGTPSHLPPKPPPSEVPSDFDLRHRTMHSYPLPNSGGPLIVSGKSSKPN